MSYRYDYATDEFLDDDDPCIRRQEVVIRRGPSPGIAAVLSVLLPGLGQVYSGRLLAGAIWFCATSLAYSAVLLPGFLVHALCIWSAYRGTPER